MASLVELKAVEVLPVIRRAFELGKVDESVPGTWGTVLDYLGVEPDPDDPLVGEHHRPDYTVSAPAVVLAAVAAPTRRIRLSSAVTVLSSDDPVRVFQQFATLDLLSGGRAEIMAGLHRLTRP